MIAGDLLNSQVNGINLVFPSNLCMKAGTRWNQQARTTTIGKYYSLFGGVLHALNTDADGSTQQMKT